MSLLLIGVNKSRYLAFPRDLIARDVLADNKSGTGYNVGFYDWFCVGIITRCQLFNIGLLLPDIGSQPDEKNKKEIWITVLLTEYSY